MKGKWLQSRFGISFDDACRATLRYPRKIIYVDYESYTEGDNIVDHFTDFNGKYNCAYGFSIYIDDRLIGSIDVYFLNGEWQLRKIDQQKEPEGSDMFSHCYDKYLDAEDVVVYRQFDGAFFFTKADTLLEVFDWDWESKAYRSVQPERHMLEMKAKIEKFKRSSSIKLPHESLEHSDSSFSYPMLGSAAVTIGYRLEQICGESSWKSNICWAACTRSILSASGIDHAQCDIVNDANL